MARNSPVSSGALVKTADAPAALTLNNNVRLQLRENSAARIWEERMSLEAGGAEVVGTYLIEAAGLKIHSLEGTKVTVELRGQLRVSTSTGLARVTSAEGQVLAFLPGGQTQSFPLKNEVASHSGCLVFKDARFLLLDDATSEIVEVFGPDLNLNVGNRVTVSGTANPRTASTPASATIAVTSVSPRSRGGCLSAAAALKAETTVTHR